MNITSIDQFKYQKYAKAVGMIDLKCDTQYITKINKHNFEKKYIKSYMKLLSKLN